MGQTYLTDDHLLCPWAFLRTAILTMAHCR